MENGGKSKTLFTNRYNDHNIGFKVFYDGIVIFYVHLNLDHHTFISTTKSSFATLCYVYSHYRYQRTCDVIPPNALLPRGGALEYDHFAHGTCIIDPTVGVPI